MKTCYQCGGPISKKSVDLELEGVIIKELFVDVCDKCGERYFDARTATFIHEITSFIKDRKLELTPSAR